jgi:CBS domain-containing protein
MSIETKDTVDGIMSRTVRTIHPDASVESALKLMAKYDVGCLVVVRNEKAVGVITERDIVRKMINKRWKGLQQHVIDVASHPVISIPPSTEAWVAFTTMLRKKIRRLPVEDHGKLVGLVTERDLFKWVVRVFYEPNIPEEFKKLVAQNP